MSEKNIYTVLSSIISAEKNINNKTNDLLSTRINLIDGKIPSSYILTSYVQLNSSGKIDKGYIDVDIPVSIRQATQKQLGIVKISNEIKSSKEYWTLTGSAIIYKVKFNQTGLDIISNFNSESTCLINGGYGYYSNTENNGLTNVMVPSAIILENNKDLMTLNNQELVKIAQIIETYQYSFPGKEYTPKFNINQVQCNFKLNENEEYNQYIRNSTNDLSGKICWKNNNDNSLIYTNKSIFLNESYYYILENNTFSQQNILSTNTDFGWLYLINDDNKISANINKNSSNIKIQSSKDDKILNYNIESQWASILYTQTLPYCESIGNPTIYNSDDLYKAFSNIALTKTIWIEQESYGKEDTAISTSGFFIGLNQKANVAKVAETQTITDSTILLNYNNGDVKNIINSTNNPKTLLVSNIPKGQGMLVRVVNNGDYVIKFGDKELIKTTGKFAIPFINVTGTIEIFGGAVQVI